MDLGLSGKRAIVCAASKGLGKASALSLAREGVDLVINSRTAETLEATAAEIAQETGVTVTPIACDITTEDGRAKVLAACPSPDILINNAGNNIPEHFTKVKTKNMEYMVKINTMATFTTRAVR